jgi:hypothetical protein
MKVIATIETSPVTIRLPQNTNLLWESCTLRASNFLSITNFTSAVISVENVTEDDIVVSTANSGTVVPGGSFVLYNDKPGPLENMTVCNRQPSAPLPNQLTIAMFSLAGQPLTITDKFEILLDFQEPRA